MRILLWWRGEDSNLRRLSRQIYSLIPLATREPLLKSPVFCCSAHRLSTGFETFFPAPAQGTPDLGAPPESGTGPLACRAEYDLALFTVAAGA